MLFNSLTFLWFFLLFWAVYRLVPFRWRLQNLLLIAGGYFFYGWWDWRFLVLLALSTLIDYAAGLGMGHTPGARARRLVLVGAIGCNLVILGFFKYYNFFAESLVQLLSLLGLAPDLPTLRVLLPVGISFYTFQSMAYAIDVYRGIATPVRNLADYAAYVAFFPQLMAGPIERARHMIPQISRPRRVGAAELGEGGFLVLLGLFKKVVVADNLAPLVQQGFTGGPHQGAAGTAVAVVAFALQIYGDFSGYSDMARGLARLLGFEIMRNFDVPYLSRTIPEFWRRWHISLSSWLRDYLYIPLGGNRLGRGRTTVNLMVTMLLGGLWHGASWTFVLWGGYHGALLAASRALERAGIIRADGGASLAARAASVAVTFGLVCGGWLVFRAESLSQAWGMLAAAAARPWSGGFGAGGTVTAALAPLGAWGACLAALDLWTLRAGEDVFIRRWSWLAQAALVLLLFYGVVLFGSREEHAFVYFQF